MKKRSILVIFAMAILILGLIYYVCFLAPYNLNGKWHENSLGISNSNSLKEIDELGQYFKGYKSEKVKYLGSNTYETFTDKGEFIIIADYSDSTFWKYRIFKLDKKLRYFTDPM